MVVIVLNISPVEKPSAIAAIPTTANATVYISSPYLFFEGENMVPNGSIMANPKTASVRNLSSDNAKYRMTPTTPASQTCGDKVSTHLFLFIEEQLSVFVES